jgi:hypothetical protein
MFIIQAIGHPVHWLKMMGKIEIETCFENSSTSRAMMASIPTFPEAKFSQRPQGKPSQKILLKTTSL